jgi:hypothetical protein
MTTSKLQKLTVETGKVFAFNKNSKIYKAAADDNSNITLTYLEFGNSKEYERQCEILKFKTGDNFDAWTAEYLCEDGEYCYFLNVI